MGPEAAKIDWQAVGTIVQVIAAVGVVVSLFYLARQVKLAAHQFRANFLKEFFAEWRSPEVQKARELLEKANFQDLVSFTKVFNANLEEAKMARRRIKHLLAWLGNLLEKRLLFPEDVFFVDLPYALYKKEDWSDGKLLSVEKDLLKETGTQHLYKAHLDSVWYAERCSQLYREFLKSQLPKA